MKIVFFGTPIFAAPILETLAKIPDFEVLKVVTQPDKPVGRKGEVTPPPVKKTALDLGLNIIQPEGKEELAEALEDVVADFFIVVAYGMIIPEKVLNIPKFGSINIHASLLPNYRGASPIHESILNGDKETGITLIKMDSKLDHGPIILIKKIEIEESDNLTTLNAKLSNLSSQVLPLALEDLKSGLLSPIEQDHGKATFCKKIEKSDGEISFDMPAQKILNMIKAYTPWPSVYMRINDKKIKILSAKVETECKEKPGTFVTDGKSLKIATSNGFVIPLKLQMEGKKIMETKDFLNGFSSLFS